MRLRHYSANVVTKVQRIQPHVMGITMKPEGLWVSDDDCAVLARIVLVLYLGLRIRLHLGPGGDFIHSVDITHH